MLNERDQAELQECGEAVSASRAMFNSAQAGFTNCLDRVIQATSNLNEAYSRAIVILARAEEYESAAAFRDLVTKGREQLELLQQQRDLLQTI